MTTYIIRAATIFGLLLSVSAITADAQSRQLIKAEIPFSFQVKDATYSAGKYLIERTTPSADNLTVILRNESGESLGILKLLPAGNRGKAADSAPSLIFSRYGDSYVFSEIHVPGEAFFGKVRKTRRETQLKHKYGEPVLAAIKAI